MWLCVGCDGGVATTWPWLCYGCGVVVHTWCGCGVVICGVAVLGLCGGRGVAVFNLYHVFICNPAPLKVPCLISIVFSCNPTPLGGICIFCMHFLRESRFREAICMQFYVNPVSLRPFVCILRGVTFPPLPWGPFVCIFT